MGLTNRQLNYLGERHIAGAKTLNPILHMLRNIRSLSPYLLIYTQADGGLAFDLDEAGLKNYIVPPPPQSSSGGGSSSGGQSSGGGSSSGGQSSGSGGSGSGGSGSGGSGSGGSGSGGSGSGGSGSGGSGSGGSGSGGGGSSSSGSEPPPPEGITLAADGLYIYGFGEPLSYLNGFWRCVDTADVSEPLSYWIRADGGSFGRCVDGRWMFLHDNVFSLASYADPATWPPTDPDYLLGVTYYTEDWTTSYGTAATASAGTTAPPIYANRDTDPTAHYIAWEQWRDTEEGWDPETMEPIIVHTVEATGTAHCIYWGGGPLPDDSETSTEI